MIVKKDLNRAKILGVFLDSSRPRRLIQEVSRAVKRGQKLFMTTPNPEFLVLAYQKSWFKDILNQADLSIPDGVGLILASWFLQTRPRLGQRTTGADLVARLLRQADENGWRVGVVGARAGDSQQAAVLLTRLQQKYPGAKISANSLGGDLVLACQGMGEQEKWAVQAMSQAKSGVFIGIGGSLDFLTGFARRAPAGLRKLGLEWAWRFVQRPTRHARRLWRACVVFPWLILKEKFSASGKLQAAS